MPDTNCPLPPPVTALIDQLARRAGFRSRIRHDVRRELTAHFEDALDGIPPEEMAAHAAALVAAFGDPRLLGTLIRRAKKRGRPLWIRGPILAAQLAVLLAVVAVAGALLQGWRAERELERGLAALEKQGLISNWGQVRSCRPQGTVFFNGRDEDSAAAFLIRLEEQPRDSLDEVSRMTEKMESDAPDIAQYIPDIRKAAGIVRPLFDPASKAAALPPTPIATVVTLGRLGGPNSQTADPGLHAITVMWALTMEAWLQYHDGHTEEAQRAAVTSLQLAAHTRDFPLVVSQLIARAAEQFAFRSLGWMGGLRDWPDTALAQLIPYTHLTEERHNALAQAVTADSLNGRNLFHKGPEAILGLRPPASISLENWFLAHVYFTRPFRFLSAPDEMDYYTHYFETGNILRKPYAATRAERDRSLRFIHASRVRLLSRTVASVIGPAIAMDLAECEARAALLRTAIAIEQHKRAHGQYPETLDALEPAACADDTLDPFTGHQLIYRPSSDAYLLYSTGLNEQDEGGVTKSDDLVWSQ